MPNIITIMTKRVLRRLRGKPKKLPKSFWDKFEASLYLGTLEPKKAEYAQQKSTNKSTT